MARDDRPWGGKDPPAIAYLYAPGRSGDHALAHLAGFTGTLQVDGYKAYNKLCDPNREGGAIALAFCWSHVRRAYYKIAQGGPKGIGAPIAPWSALAAGQPERSEALLRIQRLYRIEKDIRGRAPDERRAVRQTRARPILDALHPWLQDQLERVSSGSKIADGKRLRRRLPVTPSTTGMGSCSISTTAGSRSYQHGRAFNQAFGPIEKERALRVSGRRR